MRSKTLARVRFTGIFYLLCKHIFKLQNDGPNKKLPEFAHNSFISANCDAGSSELAPGWRGTAGNYFFVNCFVKIRKNSKMRAPKKGTPARVDTIAFAMFHALRVHARRSLCRPMDLSGCTHPQDCGTCPRHSRGSQKIALIEAPLSIFCIFLRQGTRKKYKNRKRRLVRRPGR